MGWGGPRPTQKKIYREIKKIPLAYFIFLNGPPRLSPLPLLHVHDDISPLRNFIWILITFWSSQDNLSSKKSRKTEEKTKIPNMSRFRQNMTRFHKAKTCIRHWPNRVTMIKTWHDSGNPNFYGLLHKAKTCHDLLKS